MLYGKVRLLTNDYVQFTSSNVEQIKSVYYAHKIQTN